jgi:hypothetical protein
MCRKWAVFLFFYPKLNMLKALYVNEGEKVKNQDLTVGAKQERNF